MSGIKITPIFKAGTNVKVTKVIAFAESAIKTGSVMKGILSSDIKIGTTITFVDGRNTSPVVTLNKTQDNNLIVVTDTSIYLVQR